MSIFFPFSRRVIFRGISAQMTSARDRVDAGLPTAMAAGSYVAIGTSHGFVLVFDGSQTLKYSLGGHSYGRECGSVSCLAFDHSVDEGPTRLLVGFAKGHLLEYDLTNGKLLRKLEDAHPLGSKDDNFCSVPKIISYSQLLEFPETILDFNPSSKTNSVDCGKLTRLLSARFFRENS